MKSLASHITSFAYRIAKIRKIFPCLAIALTVFLLSGYPAIIGLFVTDGKAQIDGTPKLVMLGGIAGFFMILGFMGLYFWTRTDYTHYRILFFVGLLLIFVSTLGLQLLWNIGNS
jgi:hypothetical protein